jgi:hypothetical protein
MEANKRIRGEEEFERMFFGGQNPEWFDRPANRYNIVQNKLAGPESQISQLGTSGALYQTVTTLLNQRALMN